MVTVTGRVGLLLMLLLALVLPLSAETEDTLTLDFELSLSARRQYDLLKDQAPLNPIYDSGMAILDYNSRFFRLFVDWGMVNDKKYDASEPYMGGRYLYINDAHIMVERQPFSLKGGRTTQSDIVESPYSLFVSSEPIPALQLETNYRGSRFFYTSRWVSLNRNSDKVYFGTDSEDFPLRVQSGTLNNPNVPGTGAQFDEVYPDGIPWADRGANFKVYGINAGNFRFGVQESAVYLNSNFNPEFFLSPMPMYFSQLVTDSGGEGATPWGEYANSKHVLGFFVDRRTETSYIAGQFMFDDLNGSFIPGVEHDFQDRLAWSLGGNRQFDFGRLGLYYAGATKYSFSATSVVNKWNRRDVSQFSGSDEVPLYYSRRPYPMTYYPAVEFPVDAGRMPIDYRKNYIGYRHGENNMAFMLEYLNTFREDTPHETFLQATLEYVVNGAKSPANPWHEDDSYTDISESFIILDGVLEHQILLGAFVEREVRILGVPFSVFADGELGFIFNRMRLEAPFQSRSRRFIDVFDDDGNVLETIDRNKVEPWIYRPQSGVHDVVAHLSLGIRYRFDLK